MADNNTVDSEKDLNPSEQQLDVQEHDAQIKLTKSRFVLVLVGLVLAIFLVRIYQINYDVEQNANTHLVGLTRLRQ